MPTSKSQPKSSLLAAGKPGQVPPRPTGPAVRSLRGFRDVQPADTPYWEHIRRLAGNLASGYGFSWIDPPIVEDASLFSRAAGRQSDIVTKEMYSFTDSGGDTVALRPEFTPGVVRAYLEHGYASHPQPVRLAYWGPAFRHDRPQHGRYRQFYQFGVEVIGSGAAVVDAQLVALAYHFCDTLQIPTVSVQLNSIGCSACRPVFRTELVNYYKPKRRYLCEDCKKRLVKNPLRLLDCKNADCQPHIAAAPQIVDWLDEPCRKHFMAVVEYLDGMEIPYVLNPHLVRGLDYYTRTVFEVWPSPDATGATNSLGGGGRYDDLVSQMGGLPTPAAGFSLGLDRIVLTMKERGIAPPKAAPVEVFLAQIGEAAKVKALKLYEQLRREGFSVAENFSKDSLKAQLEIANRMSARFAIIVGQKEVLDGTVLLRDMDGGMQEIVDYGKIVSDLTKKLRNGSVPPVPPAVTAPTPAPAEHPTAEPPAGEKEKE